MATAKVEGVSATIKQLRAIDPKLARESVNKIKAPTGPVVAELKGAPAAPLSGMGGHGATKAAARFGGGRRGQDIRPLVSIRLNGPGWLVASDMAHRSSPGESMVRNLTRKYGSPSRWAWPTVERHLPRLVSAVEAAVKAVERQANQAMKG